MNAPQIAVDGLFDDVHWYQRWEVFPGIFTPGRNPVDRICSFAGLPESLRGARVLDVGAWNGCFSFECERRGADEVVALSLEDPSITGFDRLKERLSSRVRYVRGSAYDLDPSVLGTFDVVLFFGVLYHLRYPLLAIDQLRRVATGRVYVESYVLQPRHLLRRPLNWLGGLLGVSRVLDSTPFWRQFEAFELHSEDQSNWFGPNRKALVESFESAGFAVSSRGAWTRAREVFVADVQQLPDRLQRHSYESPRG